MSVLIRETHRGKDRKGEGSVTMTAQSGAMQPHVKEC